MVDNTFTVAVYQFLLYVYIYLFEEISYHYVMTLPSGFLSYSLNCITLMKLPQFSIGLYLL